MNDPASFWKLVDRRAPDDCWPWLGRIGSQGYGVFGKTGAHRIAFGLANPDAKLVKNSGFCAGRRDYVRHRCANPVCVNPAHLQLGTLQENQRDRIEAKYPDLIGHAVPHIDAGAVREIRAMAVTWSGICAMMLKYCVSQGHVEAIVSRKAWRDIQ